MSPLRRWVAGFLALAGCVAFGCLLLVAAVGSGEWAISGIVLILLGATVWLGVRLGDRIGRSVE